MNFRPVTCVTLAAGKEAAFLGEKTEAALAPLILITWYVFVIGVSDAVHPSQIDGVGSLCDPKMTPYPLECQKLGAPHH